MFGYSFQKNSTIEELQVTNEELQATNEELKSTIKDLKSTKENIETKSSQRLRDLAKWQQKFHVLKAEHSEFLKRQKKIENEFKVADKTRSAAHAKTYELLEMKKTALKKAEEKVKELQNNLVGLTASSKKHINTIVEKNAEMNRFKTEIKDVKKRLKCKSASEKDLQEKLGKLEEKILEDNKKFKDIVAKLTMEKEIIQRNFDAFSTVASQNMALVYERNLSTGKKVYDDTKKVTGVTKKRKIEEVLTLLNKDQDEYCL